MQSNNFHVADSHGHARNDIYRDDHDHQNYLSILSAVVKAITGMVFITPLLAERAERCVRQGRKCSIARPDPIGVLFLIADSIPPAIFVSQGPTSWVPTIELSTNIRNMPRTQWLRFSLRTRFVTCGLLEADGEVWDDADNLVSISRQIAQVRKF